MMHEGAAALVAWMFGYAEVVLMMLQVESFYQVVVFYAGHVATDVAAAVQAVVQDDAVQAAVAHDAAE